MKVLPKNDDIRRVLFHPNAGKFRAEGPAEWPDDSFTNRRIKDGDITKEESGGDAQRVAEKPQHSQPSRRSIKE
jgi:hypothetical protein